MLVAIVVLVILVVAYPRWWSGSGGGGSNPPTQQFSYLNRTLWTFEGPTACWQGSQFSFGGTIALNGTFHADVGLTYPGGLSGPTCTAQAVSVVTHGFSLKNANVPLSVAPGTEAFLYANVTTPGSPYTGELSIQVTVVT